MTAPPVRSCGTTRAAARGATCPGRMGPLRVVPWSGRARPPAACRLVDAHRKATPCCAPLAVPLPVSGADTPRPATASALAAAGQPLAVWMHAVHRQDPPVACIRASGATSAQHQLVHGHHGGPLAELGADPRCAATRVRTAVRPAAGPGCPMTGPPSCQCRCATAVRCLCTCASSAQHLRCVDAQHPASGWLPPT